MTPQPPASDVIIARDATGAGAERLVVAVPDADAGLSLVDERRSS